MNKLASFTNSTIAVRSQPGFEEILGKNMMEAMKHTESLNLLEYVKTKVSPNRFSI